jgi:hypothetical protein
MDELKATDFGCIQLVHDFKAHDTSRRFAFALGDQRRCRRIKGSAVRAEESAAFQDRSYVRHDGVPCRQVDSGSFKIFQFGW